MKTSLEQFQNLTRTVAIIYTAFGIFLLFSMRVFADDLVPLRDFLAVGLVILYIMGLLVGPKRPGYGAVLSLIFPAFEIGQMVDVEHSEFSGYSLESLILYLVMMVPGILFLLSWYFQRRDDHERVR